MLRTWIVGGVLLLSLGCAHQDQQAKGPDRSSPSRAKTWALALHGGAGTIDRGSASQEQVAAYEASLRAALAEGTRLLREGRPAVDVVESVVRLLEEDPLFNAGRGAVFTAAGEHELDASIMDGQGLRCGAVAGVKTVRNPIRLARAVMDRTRHVLLTGEGAELFASEVGMERVPNSWFDTDARKAALEAWRTREALRTDAGGLPKGLSPLPHAYGTVGCVAKDQKGGLAAATSTGGMTGKRRGRVGDSPIIGAGNYANNATCAVSGTGTGEEFIRHGVARDVHALMAYKGVPLASAAREVVHQRLAKDDGGLIAVDREGNIALEFNSEGMYRAAADSEGMALVMIWE